MKTSLFVVSFAMSCYAAHIDFPMKKNANAAAIANIFKHKSNTDPGQPLDTNYINLNLNLTDGLNNVMTLEVSNGSQQAPIEIQLIPDTSLAEITVMTSKCANCFKFEENESWSPQGEPLAPGDFTLAYYYLIHMLETNVTGYFYEKDVCVQDNYSKSHCMTDFNLYAIEGATPGIKIDSDGFLGLGLNVENNTYLNSSTYSSMAQFKKAGLIDEMLFGFYSATWGEGTSELRLGGVNDFYMDSDSEIYYTNTIKSDSWQVPLLAVEVGGNDALNDTGSIALLNPGFPLISAPMAQFELLKSVWEDEHKEQNITCPEEITWCYFNKPCSEVQNHVMPLNFKIGNSNDKGEFEYYILEAEQFLFELDEDTSDATCHLGIFGQKYADVDYWVLGDLFMHNFYTIFNATDATTPQIGLTKSLHSTAKIQEKEYNHFEDYTKKEYGGALLLVILLLVCCAGCCCWRYNKRRNARKAERAREFAAESNAINDDEEDNVNIEGSESLLNDFKVGSDDSEGEGEGEGKGETGKVMEAENE